MALRRHHQPDHGSALDARPAPRHRRGAAARRALPAAVGPAAAVLRHLLPAEPGHGVPGLALQHLRQRAAERAAPLAQLHPRVLRTGVLRRAARRYGHRQRAQRHGHRRLAQGVLRARRDLRAERRRRGRRVPGHALEQAARRRPAAEPGRRAGHGEAAREQDAVGAQLVLLLRAGRVVHGRRLGCRVPDHGARRRPGGSGVRADGLLRRHARRPLAASRADFPVRRAQDAVGVQRAVRGAAARLLAAAEHHRERRRAEFHGLLYWALLCHGEQ